MNYLDKDPHFQNVQVGGESHYFGTVFIVTGPFPNFNWNLYMETFYAGLQLKIAQFRDCPP